MTARAQTATTQTAARKRDVQVRIASNGRDVARVQAFRYAVLAGEHGFDGQWVDHDRKLIVHPMDRTASHLYVQINGQIAAAMRMLPGNAAENEADLDAQYSLAEFAKFPGMALSFTDQLVVARAWADGKVPSLLSAAAFKLARNSGALFDFTHAAPALAGLYQKLGYRRYTDNFDDDDLGLQVPMILVMDDLEHLAALKSPFAKIARDFPLRREAVNWFHRTFPEACAHSAKALRDEDQFWTYLTSQLKQTPLHGIPLFAGLDYREALRFLKNTSVLKLAPEDALMRAGDMGNEMFVLLSGIVCVREPGSGIILARFDRGAILGEMAYLCSTPRTATVEALDDCEVLVLTQATLRRLMDSEPELAAKVLFNLSLALCERLRATNQIVQDMS